MVINIGYWYCVKKWSTAVGRGVDVDGQVDRVMLSVWRVEVANLK